MQKHRVEAFSDGVIAIILTIMVLELHSPHGATLQALFRLGSLFLSYVLSYVYIGIYWNNHHHMLVTAHRINGKIMWANLHVLFWLSLIPFATNWMGNNGFAPMPTAFYGLIMFFAAIAYTLLQWAIVAEHGPQSALAQAVGNDGKGKFSTLLYVIAIFLAFWVPWISALLYGIVAAIWFIPDKRIERTLQNRHTPHEVEEAS